MSRKTKEAKVGKVAPTKEAPLEPAPVPLPGKHDAMPEKQVLLISRAIADPRRMAMLRAIAQSTATCGGLMKCTGVSAATLSHHMKELQTAGLIDISKDGRLLQATLQKKVWKSYITTLKSLVG